MVIIYKKVFVIKLNMILIEISDTLLTQPSRFTKIKMKIDISFFSSHQQFIWIVRKFIYVVCGEQLLWKKYPCVFAKWVRGGVKRDFGSRSPSKSSNASVVVLSLIYIFIYSIYKEHVQVMTWGKEMTQFCVVSTCYENTMKLLSTISIWTTQQVELFHALLNCIYN